MEGPKGRLTVRAHSFVLDFPHGIIQVVKPALLDPQGLRLASADLVTISGIEPIRGADQTVLIKTRGAELHLIRLKNGRLQISDLFPKPTEKPSTNPISIEMENSRVTFEDQSGSRNFKFVATSPKVRLSGYDQEWSASGRVDLARVGFVDFQGRSERESGLRGTFQTPGLKGAELLSYLRQTPEGRKIPELMKVTMASSLAKGSGLFILDPQNKLRFELQGGCELRQVQYAHYPRANFWFTGLLSSIGLRGQMRAEAPDMTALWDGGAKFGQPVRASGNLSIHLKSLAAIPDALKTSIPAGIAASDLNYQGWVSINGTHNVGVRGRLTAKTIQAKGYPIDAVQADLDGNLNQIDLRLNQAKFSNRKIDGFGSFAMKTKELNGFAKVDEPIPLAQFVPRSISGVSGNLMAKAILGGTLSTPLVYARMSGDAAYHAEGNDPLNSNFYVSAQTNFKSAKVDRITIAGDFGRVVASGDMSEQGALKAHITARSINPESFTTDLAGTFNGIADVSGNLKTPIVQGRVEGYDLLAKGEPIAAASTNFLADKSKVFLKDIQAFNNAAHLQGEATLDLNTHNLSGLISANGLQVADFLGDKFVGFIDVPSVQLNGTFTEPTALATLRGESLVAESVKVDGFSAVAEINRNRVKLQSSAVKLGAGELTATGEYELGTKESSIHASFTPLALADLSAALPDELALEGTMSGSLDFTGEGLHINRLNGNGRFANVKLNGVDFGSGPWQSTGQDDLLTASLSVGQLDRFISLNRLRIDLRENEPHFNASVDLFNLNASDIIHNALLQKNDLSPDAVESLRAISGKINATILAEGTLANPKLELKNFEAEELAAHGQPLGKISANANWQSGKLVIDQFGMEGPLLEGTISGTIAQDGDISLNGELSKVDLSALGGLSPALSNLSGRLNSSFEVSGKTASPRIEASLGLTGLFADAKSGNEDRSLRAQFAPVIIEETQHKPGEKPSGGISVSGEYFYRGFVGSIDLSAPFSYPAKFPDDQPIQGKVMLSKRNLKEIAAITGGLDPNQTVGSISGSATVGGTLAKPDIEGLLNVRASKFAFKDFEGGFENLDGSVAIQQNKLNLSASASSARGGTAKVEAQTSVAQIIDSLLALKPEAMKLLKAQELGGSVTLDQFKVRKGFSGKEYVQADLNASLKLAGTLGNPAISGKVDAANLESIVPVLALQPGAATNFPIDPSFAINFSIPDAAHLRAPAADLYVTGDGTISGSLSNLSAAGKATVEQGSITLPAATVRLDPGGSVAFDYQSAQGTSFAHTKVDFTGLTQLTANDGTNQPKRYDITLNVSGDILKDNGLILDASSDPPLGQDRILGLLGSTDRLQNLTSAGTSNQGTGAQIQSALLGLAAPSLLDSVTSGIAQKLGLQYLQVGFDPFQKASFTFAKSIGTEFTFQGSRQISQPIPGYPQQFDVRLVYRPRRLLGVLRRLSFYVGADETKPFKFSLEYGSSFHLPGNQPERAHSLFK